MNKGRGPSGGKPWGGGGVDILLTPQNGRRVRLNSFDLGGFPALDYPNQPTQILDAGLNVLLDLSGTVTGAGPSHSSFSPNVISTGPIHIRFGNTTSVGIDNINFDELAPTGPAVPEPGTFLLFAGGVALGTLVTVPAAFKDRLSEQHENRIVDCGDFSSSQLGHTQSQSLSDLPAPSHRVPIDDLYGEIAFGSVLQGATPCRWANNQSDLCFGMRCSSGGTILLAFGARLAAGFANLEALRSRWRYLDRPESRAGGEFGVAGAVQQVQNRVFDFLFLITRGRVDVDASRHAERLGFVHVDGHRSMRLGLRIVEGASRDPGCR